MGHATAELPKPIKHKSTEVKLNLKSNGCGHVYTIDFKNLSPTWAGDPLQYKKLKKHKKKKKMISDEQLHKKKKKESVSRKQ